LPKLYIRCNPFYSLPKFPAQCQLVTNTDLVLRNILLCNLNDRNHFDNGKIIDPYIEGDKDGKPLYMICKPESRKSFERERRNFNEEYLIFRTNYIRDRDQDQIIVGFYYIEDFQESDNGPILIASKSKSKFLSAKTALELSKELGVNEYVKKHNLYRASFYEDPHREKLDKWLNDIQSTGDNKLTEYQKESERLAALFQRYKPTDENYPTCFSCQESIKNSCPLEKRKKAWGSPPKTNAFEDPKKGCKC